MKVDITKHFRNKVECFSEWIVYVTTIKVTFTHCFDSVTNCVGKIGLINYNLKDSPLPLSSERGLVRKRGPIAICIYHRNDFTHIIRHKAII